MDDRQVVIRRGAPDRFEIGVIRRDMEAQRRLHRDRPIRLAPGADLPHGAFDIAPGRAD
jgi:hypothetical protein